jgi:hypothetical protein
VISRSLRSFLVLAALGPVVSAADLTVAGVSHSYVSPGQSLSVTITGTPGEQVLLLVDPVPGPLQLGNKILGVGGSAAMELLELGTMPGSGVLVLNTSVDNNPTLVDQSVYAVGAVGNGTGFDITNDLIVSFVERSVDLAGEPLGSAPFFQYVSAFNANEPVDVSVDPSRHPQVVGDTADVYVVASKTAVQWNNDAALVDLSNDGPNTITFGSALLDNILQVDSGTLNADAGDGLGVGYDIVVDLDQNGQLDGHDLIDGYGDVSGMYAVHDVTRPGPYAVNETIYSGGTWLDQDLYYPSNIASLGQQPLVIISHGNGHNYQWYDHLGRHLASYGFIVMSHSNNTGPGITTASTTTLTNTDYFLGNLGSIAGGALVGHVQTDNIAWIGHSRGGEGVAKAYDRLVDEGYPSVNFGPEDIVLISSIAPTDFQGPGQSNPHDKAYHLWVGGSDSDVTGCASNHIAESFHLLGRASQRRTGISLHGVGHGDFHDGGGSSWATGPCQVGRSTTHIIMRGYALPLLMAHQRANVPAEDFLWRQWESFHPIGAPFTNPCVTVDLQLREGDDDGRFIIDNFQDATPDVNTSSEGLPVTFTVANRTDGRMDDPDTNFTHSASEAFNGFTYARPSDTERGTVFDWDNVPSSITWEVGAGGQNARAYDHISLRAAQGTRHPLTTAELGDLSFDVTLEDHMGNTSTLSIDAFGGGVEEPYQRSSCGTGVGWGAEFETISLRLLDFEADGSDFDLGNLATVTLSFGPGAGSLRGRLGLDDLQLVQR